MMNIIVELEQKFALEGMKYQPRCHFQTLEDNAFLNHIMPFWLLNPLKTIDF